MYHVIKLIILPRLVDPLLLVNIVIIIMLLPKYSSKYLFLYFSEFYKLVIEYGILQEHFDGFEYQN
jgi:hypothetical protein